MEGPWTDIHAIAAIFYQTVTGRKPDGAEARARQETLVPATQLAAGRFPVGLLSAIDQGLGLAVSSRPRSLDEWRAYILANALNPSGGSTTRSEPAQNDSERSETARAKTPPFARNVRIAATSANPTSSSVTPTSSVAPASPSQTPSSQTPSSQAAGSQAAGSQPPASAGSDHIELPTLPGMSHSPGAKTVVIRRIPLRPAPTPPPPVATRRTRPRRRRRDAFLAGAILVAGLSLSAAGWAWLAPERAKQIMWNSFDAVEFRSLTWIDDVQTGIEDGVQTVAEFMAPAARSALALLARVGLADATNSASGRVSIKTSSVSPTVNATGGLPPKIEVAPVSPTEQRPRGEIIRMTDVNSVSSESDHVVEQERRQQVEALAADVALWERIRSATTAALHSIFEQFPHGVHAEEAVKLRDQGQENEQALARREQERQNSNREAEELAWANVKAKPSADALKAFIERHPHSAHVPEIAQMREHLAAVEAEQKKNPQEEAATALSLSKNQATASEVARLLESLPKPERPGLKPQLPSGAPTTAGAAATAAPTQSPPTQSPASQTSSQTSAAVATAVGPSQNETATNDDAFVPPQEPSTQDPLTDDVTISAPKASTPVLPMVEVPTAPSAGPSSPIPWRNGVYEKKWRKQNIQDVLKDIMAANKLKITFEGSVNDSVSFWFHNISLKNAFMKIMQDHRLSYRYDPATKTVIVSGP
ncbi:hypothetical protein CCP2SC5_190031 [Azospirillaceae bacterium]